MFKRAYDAYQSHDTSKIMMFEGSQFPDEWGVAGGIVFNTGYDSLPGGDNVNNQLLNDHTYCCQMGADVCSSGEPPISMKEECYKWHEARINTRAADAERLQVPLIISEFGACYDSKNCSIEINAVGDICDQQLTGWAYWQFKNLEDLTTSAGTGSEGFYNFDGTLQTIKVKALSRTYAMKTQGVLKEMLFDKDSGDFTMQFAVNTNSKAPTEIARGLDLKNYAVTVKAEATELKEGEQYTNKVVGNQHHIEIIDEALNGESIFISLKHQAAIIE